MKSGIYEIRNITNGHRYIGSAKNLSRRIYNHKNYLKNNTHGNRHLQNAWNKYGNNQFRFSVLVFCDLNNLLLFEQLFLDGWNCEYNIAPIAGSQLGCKRNEESRKKMSETRKRIGYRHSEETRKKISMALTGMKLSEDCKQKLSEINRGKILSDEHKKKISKSLKGKIVSDETRKKISDATKGKGGHKKGAFSKEHRQKLSIATKNYYQRKRLEEARAELAERKNGKKDVD